jgi:pimeloyl-ACP methyl ester carboxylesterase
MNLNTCLLAALLTACAVDDVELDEVTSEVTVGSLEFVKDGATWYLPYARNAPLGTPNGNFKRAIVVVHGSERNLQATYDAMWQAVMEESKCTAATQSSCFESFYATTLVIAPHFQECGSDWRLCWDGFWKWGGYSRDVDLSSFEIVDEILRRLQDGRFPALQRITVVGHSAGGQFTQRYAALGRAKQGLIPQRFVVANPSSYVYMNQWRPSAGTWWKIPSATSSACSTTYNNYGYGLAMRSDYVDESFFSDDVARSRYIAKEVVYLIGEDDTNTDPEQGFDNSCEAMLQGGTRTLRAHHYYRHVDTYYPTHRHRLSEVPDAGHSASQMYPSATGRAALFR